MVNLNSHSIKYLFLPLDCGGITYKSSNKKFTLRKGTDLKDSASEISWVEGNQLVTLVSASYRYVTLVSGNHRI